MRTTVQTPKLMVREFDSLGDFYDYAIYDESHPEWARINEQGMASRTGSADFAGTRNWDDAVKLARDGWTGGLDKLNYKLENTDNIIKDIKNKFKTIQAVAGAFVDVPLFIQGEPECMVEFENTVENSFATIYVSLAVHSGVDTDEITTRGRKVMEVIDALEQNNIRTKVVLVSYITGSHGFFGGNTGADDCVIINAKSYRDRLDIESLNFAICHSSFFRRILFAALERAPSDWREKMGYTSSYAYGRPTDSIKTFVSGDDPYILFDSHAGGAYEDINKQVLKMIRREQFEVVPRSSFFCLFDFYCYNSSNRCY